MENASIAIVGAGPAGLCLARILQRNGAKVIVFEADASRNARRQGGSLDLHGSTGQRALRAAGLYDAFLAKIQPGADALVIMDHNMRVYYEDHGGGDRPEIEREDLRDILLDSLELGTVQWGRKLLRVEPPAEQRFGQIKLIFSDKSCAEADIVVGADGAWSKVRAVLTDLKPEVSGIIMDVLLPRNIDLTAFKRGTLWAIDNDANLIIAHLADAPHAYLGRFAHPPDDSSCLAPPQGWAKELTALVTHPEAIRSARQLLSMPSGSRWTRDAEWKSRVAIIGDAAHVMSPFAGEGANLALIDAADLAEVLLACRKREDVGPAIVKFEQRRMWGRAERAAKKSAQNQSVFAGPGGAPAVAKMMREFFTIRNILRMFWQWVARNFWELLGCY